MYTGAKGIKNYFLPVSSLDIAFTASGFQSCLYCFGLRSVYAESHEHIFFIHQPTLLQTISIICVARTHTCIVNYHTHKLHANAPHQQGRPEAASAFLAVALEQPHLGQLVLLACSQNLEAIAFSYATLPARIQALQQQGEMLVK